MFFSSAALEYRIHLKKECFVYGKPLHTMIDHWTQDKTVCKKWCNSRRDCGGFVAWQDKCKFQPLDCGLNLEDRPWTTTYIKEGTCHLKFLIDFDKSK